MFVPPAEFEPEILASERPQTHALDLAATGIGPVLCIINCNLQWSTFNFVCVSYEWNENQNVGRVEIRTAGLWVSGKSSKAVISWSISSIPWERLVAELGQ
jgi:hypothetical protein